MKYLTVAVIISMLGFAACAGGDSEKDFEVQPIEGGKSIEITKYIGSKSDVKIPSKIKGLPVTHIGGHAFSGKNLVSVIIPNSVTTIGGSAFRNNKLTDVTIPNGVIAIGGEAFIGNPLDSVTIPSSVTEITKWWNESSSRARWEGEPFPNMPDSMFTEQGSRSSIDSRGNIRLNNLTGKFIPGNYIYKDGKWSKK